jgi:magnesium-transporting ATPase (P-type)
MKVRLPFLSSPSPYSRLLLSSAIGLRTLCLAYKPLEEEEYEVWERDYHEATTLIEGREDGIEAVADRLERELILLGATAIEDKLQDGVPEAIADLKRAGIKVRFSFLTFLPSPVLISFRLLLDLGRHG